MAFIAYLLASAGGKSTDNQKNEIQDYTRKKSIRVDNYITVETPSSKGERNQRIKDLFSGINRWDTVIVSDLSGIGHDIAEIINIVKDLSGRGVRFIAAKQDIDLNGPGDASSKLMTATFDMLAGLERDLASARIKGALAGRKKDGIVLGRPKGSLSSSKLDSKKELIIDYLSKGVSKTSLARILETSTSNLLSYLKTRRIEVSRKVKAPRAASRMSNDVVKNDVSNDIVRKEDEKKSRPVQSMSGQLNHVVTPEENREVQICRHCGRDMLDPRTTTCAGGYIDYKDGESYPRVRYSKDEEERCPKCGVEPGRFHHDGCYLERCPRCGERLVSCGCKKA